MNIFKKFKRSSKNTKPMTPGAGFQSLEVQESTDENTADMKAKPTETHTNGAEELHVPQQKNPQVSAMPMPMEKNIGSSSPSLKKFDILVFDKDESGHTIRKEVNGVFASSAKELLSLYQMCEQKIQILREYPSQNEKKAPQSSPPQQNALPPPQSPEKFEMNFRVKDFGEEREKNTILQPEPISDELRQAYKEMMAAPPKFFEIGGVKCKLEKGKMYQEQWVKVDAAKYRIISDKTNKIVPLTDKHLETLKWVLIEDEKKEEEESHD